MPCLPAREARFFGALYASCATVCKGFARNLRQSAALEMELTHAEVRAKRGTTCYVGRSQPWARPGDGRDSGGGKDTGDHNE